MLDEAKEFWGYVLATAPSGQSISVGQVVSVLGLLIGGYFVSRLVGYFSAADLPIQLSELMSFMS